MGDPKKQRKKYSTPGHPWQRARIEEEKQLMHEYGFKNKTEIWKMVSFLRDATAQAKKLVTLSGPQAEKEKELLLSRLKRYGLLPAEAVLDAILSISLRDVLERRLQTIVYKKNLANSVKQARQFITHEHIMVADKIVTSPSYLVPLKEEGMIRFRDSSKISDPEHPERIAARQAKEKESKEKVVVKEGSEDKKGRADDKQRAKRRAPARDKPKEKGNKGAR
ncbi:30S ribosomal protein S4 [Candidatus Woesearchaeota archaeon]|nr:30S ribosomal protein S4 [Candidatus Woesearchaeota archaeon]